MKDKLSLMCGLTNRWSYSACVSSLTFGSVDEVRGDVAAVELQTLNDLQLIVQSLPILRCKTCTDYVTSHNPTYKSYTCTFHSETNLDSNDSLAANFLHGIGYDGTDLHVSIG